MNAVSTSRGDRRLSLWPSFIYSSGIHVAAILLIVFSPSLGHKGTYKAPRALIVSLVEIPAAANKTGTTGPASPSSRRSPAAEKRIAPPEPPQQSTGKELQTAKKEMSAPAASKTQAKLKEISPAPPGVAPMQEVSRRSPPRPFAPAPPAFSLPPLPSVGVSKETAQLQGEGSSGGTGSSAANPAASISSGSKSSGAGGGGERKSERGGQGLGVASGLPGVSVDNPDFQFTYYLVIIQNKISSNWTPPYKAGRPGEKRKTVVAFRILRNGQVQDVRLETSSGASYLDQSALRAISRSSPLPPLPQRFLDESLGVHFSFELEGGTS